MDTVRYQAYRKHGSRAWEAVGPVCYNEKEAEGYADFYVRWRVAEGYKAPETKILVKEVKK